ncbi:hypothetical protein A1O1_01224, partial [Capronia coronata CBS 617.96]
VLTMCRTIGVQIEGRRPRRTEESGMLNVFVYGGQSVLDLIILENDRNGRAGKGRLSSAGGDEHRTQVQMEDDLVVALTEVMDALTDSNIVQDALPYRALL